MHNGFCARLTSRQNVCGFICSKNYEHPFSTIEIATDLCNDNFLRILFKRLLLVNGKYLLGSQDRKEMAGRVFFKALSDEGASINYVESKGEICSAKCQ